MSRGGISVVAMPSAYGAPPRSRIVPKLDGAVVSLPRQIVDVVMTENGIADLRGRTAFERTEMLIAVAAPGFRAELEAAWGEIKREI